MFPHVERRSLNDDNKIEVDSNTWLRPLETTLNFSGRRWNVTGSRKVSVGGYSRSYSEKRYQVNRTRHHEKHSNRSVETETRLTFHRMTPGDFYGPFGMHRLTVRNQTFTGPSGESLNAEFSNITYFDGIPEDRGEDNIHPLTYITQKLIKKELVDGGTFMKECILWMWVVIGMELVTG